MTRRIWIDLDWAEPRNGSVSFEWDLYSPAHLSGGNLGDREFCSSGAIVGQVDFEAPSDYMERAATFTSRRFTVSLEVITLIIVAVCVIGSLIDYMAD